MSEEKVRLFPWGCYFVQYWPKVQRELANHFDGVLRHTPENPRIRASADLYEHLVPPQRGGDTFPQHCIAPPGGMPVFPPDSYRYYLEVQQVTEGYPDEHSIALQFQVHQFDSESKTFIRHGGRTAILRRSDDYKFPGRFRGPVLNEQTAEVVGEMEIRLASSEFLREAVIQIDSDDGLPLPMHNGLPQRDENYRDWTRVFQKCGWRVSTEPTESSADKPGAAALAREWTDAELHARVQALSKSSEKEWRYHLLCVGTFANPQYERGVMYDIGGGDLNGSPREGSAIAAGWSMAKAGWPKSWPKLAEKQHFYEAKELYFRTAVHELGHAMGLAHSHESMHYMNTTDALHDKNHRLTKQALQVQEQAKRDALFARVQADALQKLKPDDAAIEELRQVEYRANAQIAKAAGELALAEFPKNITWDFSDADQDRLQHGPDVMVRPGTFVEGTVAGFGDKSVHWAEGLEMQLTPLLDSVPLGAPVRVRITLRNKSNDPQQVPRTLHLKSGCVEGVVFGPGGQPVRSFYPLMQGDDLERLQELEPGDSLHHSMTLLRGHEGALFSRPGDHVIRVKVSWRRRDDMVYLEKETRVRVEAAGDLAHQVAALSVLSSPAVLLGLALGVSDPATSAVIDACLAVPVLRPHYAVVRLKQVLTSSIERLADLGSALESGAVLSISEINRAIELLDELIQEGKVTAAEAKGLRESLDGKKATLARTEKVSI